MWWGVQEKDWGYISHLGGSLRGWWWWCWRGPVVGMGLMNTVHLAELRGPNRSLVQTRSTDQSRGNPRRSIHSHANLPPSHPEVLPAIPLLSLGCPFDRLLKKKKKTQVQIKHAYSSPPVPQLPVSPDGHGEPWSPGCGIFWLISSAQSSGACLRIPSSQVHQPSQWLRLWGDKREGAPAIGPCRDFV